MMRVNLIKESEMVDEFVSQMSSEAYFVREVPVFAKSVDIVKVDINKKRISAIEFKTTNWRKAELQVLGSAIAFDFLEICIIKPITEKCRNSIIEECEEQGIGLYFMDNDSKVIEHVVKPIHREGVWERQRKQIVEYVSQRIQK